MAEIRWILLGLGLILIAGIWWRGARRRAQGPGDAELRKVEPRAAPAALPLVPSAHQHPPDWGVSPLEPLSIKTADFDHVPVLDLPMRADFGAIPQEAKNLATAPATAPATAAVPAPHTRPKPNANELQKIVTVRVCASGGLRWGGKQLMEALADQGLVYGRYQVYHHKHVDGSTLFYVASLVEPGTFDMALMAEQEFRGVSAFAVLPGPLEPVQTIDAMFAAVRGLAERLSGMAQDANGAPLSPQRVGALRDEVARYQALLS